MTEYGKLFSEAVNVYGVKRVLYDVLKAGGVVDNDKNGLVVVRVNNGIITEVLKYYKEGKDG